MAPLSVEGPLPGLVAHQEGDSEPRELLAHAEVALVAPGSQLEREIQSAPLVLGHEARAQGDRALVHRDGSPAQIHGARARKEVRPLEHIGSDADRDPPPEGALLGSPARPLDPERETLERAEIPETPLERGPPP